MLSHDEGGGTMMTYFDPANGTFLVPWWGIVGILALIVGLAVVAVLRTGGARMLAMLLQMIVAAAVIAVGWSIVDRMGQRDRMDARRALDARMDDLAARTMAPGSPLGCLDPVAADALDESCEKVLFSAPESVAGAVSFVSAQLTLLSDMTAAGADRPGFADQIVGRLRRVLERDRFGFVAHILATRDSCTEDKCQTFGLFGDTGRIVANLQGHAFETRLERASAAWPASRRPQGSALLPGMPPASGEAPAAPSAQAPATANFPTASSIPPVSIMNNEPGFAGQNGVEESKAAPKPPAAPKRASASEKPAAPRRAQRTAPPAPPVQLAPQPPAAQAPEPPETIELTPHAQQ